ncbi:MAG: LacI family DNA-binding transcriptional regulator [Roseivivax sp.]|nr:LacI family DNA-binding transcriptional regulator [Roseivivax sp.]
MTKAPTISDLAQAAGLSVATVDRVLHGRANVSDRALRRVVEAAERIGFRAAALPAVQTARPSVRLGFVLHKGNQAFYRNFTRAIEDASQARSDVAVTADIRFSPSQGPEDFARALREAAAENDVIAGTSVNHPETDRTAAAIVAAGTPLFCLLNDFARAERQAYFGLDNIRVGRIAGWMLATQIRQAGKIAVFVGGTRWSGHVLRETGLRSYLREHAPQLALLDAFVNLETRHVTYEATLELLSRHADLRGIYVAGGGMEGAIAGLREMRPAGKVALVVNELTEDSRAALADRYVSLAIATPLEDLCRSAVDAMVRAARNDSPPAGQCFLDPRLYVPEMV